MATTAKHNVIVHGPDGKQTVIQANESLSGQPAAVLEKIKALGALHEAATPVAAVTPAPAAASSTAAPADGKAAAKAVAAS